MPAPSELIEAIALELADIVPDNWDLIVGDWLDCESYHGYQAVILCHDGIYAWTQLRTPKRNWIRHLNFVLVALDSDTIHVRRYRTSPMKFNMLTREAYELHDQANMQTMLDEALRQVRIIDADWWGRLWEWLHWRFGVF